MAEPATMNSELDSNKIAAEVIVAASAKFLEKTSEPLTARLRRVYQGVFDAYAPFLEKTYARVSRVRTFLKPTESVDLLSIYIPVDLTDKETDFDVAGVIEKLQKGEKIIVSGLAGRGKSVLMRYIAISLYHAPMGRIPVFLELRSLNSLTTKSVLQFIHSQYKGESSIQFSDFIDAMKKGMFILILDGFDEISPSERDDIARQINDIALEYARCPLILSGRPDERFQAWEYFTTLHLKPMTLRQTRSLIQGSSYDDEVKRTFLKRLTPEFFKKHESFVNTPLLAIMLMKTYEEYAEIPVSLHEFYRNAFDTLARRHDAMKAQFSRETHSGCNAEELKKLMASFCLLTYSKSEFTFHRDEVVDHIKACIRQMREKYDAEKVLCDLIESVCILQEEGFEISFVHRSFQEYFCALFVSVSKAGFVEKYLNSGRFRVWDDVLPMLYGMVPGRVEAEWAADAVTSLIEKYPPNDAESAAKLAMSAWDRVDIQLSNGEATSATLSDTPLAQTIAILRRLYPAQFHTHVTRGGSKSKAEQEWGVNIVTEGLRLQEYGDPQFRTFSSLVEQSLSDRSKYSVLHVDLSSSHMRLVELMFGDYFRGVLKALATISRDQRARRNSDDAFLKEVFAE